MFDITPKAIRIIVNGFRNDSPANKIREEYMKYKGNRSTGDNFYDGLNQHEEGMLRDLDDGFCNCDTTFLCKIIKKYELVQLPTHGWNRKVEDLKNYGDVIELLKQVRNSFVHRPQVKFSDKILLYITENIVQSVVVVSDNFEEPTLLKEMESHLEWL